MDHGVKVNQQKAETIYVSHPEASYGIFCYNSLGDLFLNSDWGAHFYSWRAFSPDFKEFLSETNTEYLIGKFETSYNNTGKKRMPDSMKRNVCKLIDAFLEKLKENNKWIEDPNVAKWKDIAEELHHTAIPMLQYIGGGFSETREFEEASKKYEEAK